MRRSLPWVMLLCALSAQAGELALTLGADVQSNYVFRGSKRGPFGVTGHATAKYPLWAGAAVVGNLDQFMQIDNHWGFSETTANVGLQFKPPLVGRWASAEAGLTWYAPSKDLATVGWSAENTHGKSTQEFYLRTSFDALPFSPSVDFFKDVNKRSALDTQLSVSKSFRLKPWTVGVSGLINWQFGNGLSGWRAAGLRGSFSYQLGQHLSFGPMVDLWFPRNQIDANAKGFRPVVGFGVNWSPAMSTSHRPARPGALGPLP